MFEDSTTLELIFKIANSVALVGWIILILLPRRWTLLTLLPTMAIPILLSLAYSVIAVASFSQPGEGGFGSLAEVKQLFSSDVALLAGWIHYLAFDLFIGGIIARHADKIGLHRVVQAPILFFTFMLGPLGFFLYQCTYGGWRWISDSATQPTQLNQ